MQSYSEPASTVSLRDTRQPLINNDKTLLTCSSGTAFPTQNLFAGRLCFRTDQSKLYQRNTTNTAWVLIADLSKTLQNKEDADLLYSPANHNHDANYAAIGHDHTGIYAPAAHTHTAADLSGVVKTASASTMSAALTFATNVAAKWGSAGEWQISHNGVATYMRSYLHGGPVYLQGEDAAGANKTMMSYDPDGASFLYYAGTKKFETTNTGAKVTGTLVTDAGTLGSNGNGNATVSTAAPSGGADGDTWHQV